MTLAPSGHAVQTPPPATVAACPNCGEVATARARYCSGCGQRLGANLLSVRVLIGEVLEEALSLDGRLPRTMRALLLRPGHLTREYTAGRIARYVRPFRLYLVSSIIFFLALSMTIKLDPERVGAGRDRITMELTNEPDANEDAATAGEAAAQAPGAEASAGVAATAPVPDSLGMTPLPADQAPAAATAARSETKHATRSGNRLERFLRPFIKSAQDDPANTLRRLTERLLRDAPKAVVILLPIFALFLKLLYIRRRRLYVEHLVFVLHLHAFAFLLATPLLLLPSHWLTGLLWLFIPLYLFWAMRRVYGQSRKRTALKFFIFGWFYFFSVVFTLVTVLILAAVAL